MFSTLFKKDKIKFSPVSTIENDYRYLEDDDISTEKFEEVIKKWHDNNDKILEAEYTLDEAIKVHITYKNKHIDIADSIINIANSDTSDIDISSSLRASIEDIRFKKRLLKT